MTRAPTSTAPTRRRRGWARTWLVTLLILLIGVGGAQTTTSTGATEAALTFTGRVDLGPLVRLQLGATELDFDLQQPLDAPGAPLCVVAPAVDGVESGGFGASATVTPAGTSFRSVDWPRIEVVGGSPLVVFPPPSGDRDLAVVCYRSFVIEPYANLDGWQLAVSRSDPVPDTGLQMYLAGTCQGEPDAGLQVLGDGGSVVLASDRLAGSCGAMLAVLALRVEGLAAGETVAELQYTLLTADADFGIAPEERP